MKRFYADVAVSGGEQGYGIELDGRPLRTPSKAVLLLPTRRLADAIAAEWARQGEKIRPLEMPLTQLANTALDRVPPRRADLVAEIAAYAETDMLCYRASSPSSLVEAQAAHWQPLLDWTEATYGARFRLTDGILPVEQDTVAVRAIEGAVAGQSDFALAALHLATTTAGSVLIGLALVSGRIEADAAHSAASVDERHQIETWGHDDEAQARLDRLLTDIRAAGDFASALRQG